MVRSDFKKLNISLDEGHLVDIYSNTSKYLELGTIDFATLPRLFNYELIELEDITYLPIQNRGFSASRVKNEKIKSLLPFVYFQNINQKNRPMQVFITHGMIRYKENNQEFFAPLLLIPVNIYFEDGKVLFQQISPPVENKVLLNKLQKENGIDITTIEKLDNLQNIDRFLYSLEKHEELDFALENFLTYARVIGSEALINQNKFDLSKGSEVFLNENLYSTDNIVYYSKKYNFNQRRALHQALSGESFLITGRLGSGKTRVLKDIAINAIAAGKRVLYVSNMKETLKSVRESFASKDMDNYLTDFTNSFASFHTGELIIDNPKPITSASNFDTLLSNYDYIAAYQHAMTGRILDFRFIDVINELLLLEGLDKTKLEIDDLNNIYKYEYQEILEAVENIQENLNEEAYFQQNVWKEIPIINDIKYPNQVISLIHKAHNGFVELEEYKNILEGDYGFKTIGNYAYLKNILHNFKNLNISEVPKSWYDKNNFELVKGEYHKLKTLIFSLQELKYDLDIRYDNIEKFNINKEIQNLYGDFFTKEDFGKINRIIEDRLNVIVILNKALVQIDIFNKSSKRVKKLINYDFVLDSHVLETLIELAEILTETNLNPSFVQAITNGKFKLVLKEAKAALSNYLEYNQELAGLFTGLSLPKFGTIEETVKVLNDYQKNLSISWLQRRAIDKMRLEDEVGYEKLLKAIARYNELIELIAEADNKFNQLLCYHPDQVYIDDFIRLNDFLNGIENLTIKSRILKFFKRNRDLDFNKKKAMDKTFSLFYKSYNKINNFYDELIAYEFLEEKINFSEKINDIQKINSYVQKSFHANDLLYSSKKLNTNEYVKAEDYYYIYETFNQIEEISRELETNSTFPYLFGNMYKKQNTNLGNLSKVIKAYRAYTECFQTDESLVNSFNSEIYSKIDAVLDTCLATIDNLNEVFKLYFKLFKSSVSRFYYSELSENIVYLAELLKNKQSLISYLHVTDNLEILAKHQLYKFIEYIINLKDTRTLVNDFKYTYLTNLKEMYLEKNMFLSNYKSFQASLNISVNLENEIIKAIEDRVIQKIRKKSGTRFSVFGVGNLDYNSYIRRTNNFKHLFLTNTQVLNNFLNIKHFDLVLIDDAHIFEANEYSYALQGRQVVIAGELQLQEAVANNLVSRISASKSILFNYRYDVIPKNLKNHAKGLLAPINKNFYENYGVEVIKENIEFFIVSLYKENEDCKINLFIGSLLTQRNLYEAIANSLLEAGFGEKEIFEILMEKLNIVDLKQAYLINSDYNIVFLEDYYHLEEDYLVANLIDNLLLCKKRLIIYDNNNYLQSNERSNFLIELSRVIESETVFSLPETISSMKRLISVLEENKFICYASDLCTFVIRKKSNIYGITVYWDYTKTNYDILNEFRDIHALQAENIKKNIIVWAMELVDDFAGVVARIIQEVNYD